MNYKFNFSEIGEKNEKTFVSLFRMYNNDLKRYSERLRENPIREKDIYENYVNDPSLYKLYIKDGRTIVGFIVLQYVYELETPAWYIVEFYIMPRFRHRGYGTRAVESFLDKYDGDFFYYVLKENIPAQKFWSKMTEKFKLNEVKRNDISELDDCYTHSFRR